MSFSVELVLEEKVEYNDLANTIQKENSSKDDEYHNVQTTHLDGEKDVVPEKGITKWLQIILFEINILFLITKITFMCLLIIRYLSISL